MSRQNTRLEEDLSHPNTYTVKSEMPIIMTIQHMDWKKKLKKKTKKLNELSDLEKQIKTCVLQKFTDFFFSILNIPFLENINNIIK